MSSEHPLPLFLPDLFSVVCAGQSLRRPFLLEIGPLGYMRLFHEGEVVEVVFVP